MSYPSFPFRREDTWRPLSDDTESPAAAAAAAAVAAEGLDDDSVLNIVLEPADSFVNGRYWADLPLRERTRWATAQFNGITRREIRNLLQISRGDPLKPITQYFSHYVVPGMGMFTEGYTLFSVGNNKSLFKAVWPACWSQHKICSNQWISAVTYLEMIGIIFGQIFVGLLGDFIGRRWGLIQDAAIMFLGTVMLTVSWGTTLLGWVICYAFSLFVYGIGVGGEYPMTSTSVIEGGARAKSSSGCQCGNGNYSSEGCCQRRTFDQSRHDLARNEKAASANEKADWHGESSTYSSKRLRSGDYTTGDALLDRQSDDRLHRGRSVVLAFTMQGWGQFINQALLLLLLIIFNGGSREPFSTKTAHATFRVSFAFIALLTLWLLYYRVFKMEYHEIDTSTGQTRNARFNEENIQNTHRKEIDTRDSSGDYKGLGRISEIAEIVEIDKSDRDGSDGRLERKDRKAAHKASSEKASGNDEKQRLREKSNDDDEKLVGGNLTSSSGAAPAVANIGGGVTGYSVESMRRCWRHYWHRLIGTAGGWFCNDFFFYGNKMFQSTFIEVISPNGDVATNWRWNLVNIGCAMVGYYLAAVLIDHKMYGRKRMQMIGFMADFIMFLVAAAIFDKLTQPGAPIKVLMFLYFFSSFFVQFGPNCTTFLVAAEVFPAQVRSSAHGFAAAFGKVGALIPAVLFNFIDDRTIFWVVCWFGLLGAVLTLVLVPDSTGLDMREQERYWSYVNDNREHEYHGVAVHPQHLSLFERVILKRDRFYDPEKDREAKKDELRQLYEATQLAADEAAQRAARAARKALSLHKVSTASAEAAAAAAVAAATANMPSRRANSGSTGAGPSPYPQAFPSPLSPAINAYFAKERKHRRISPAAQTASPASSVSSLSIDERQDDADAQGNQQDQQNQNGNENNN